MYCVEKEQYAHVSSMQLNEELGQVAYVFTDKTGTLVLSIFVIQRRLSIKCPLNMLPSAALVSGRNC